MGLIYHAALKNSLIMCFMDSRREMRHFPYFATSGILPVSRRQQNEVDDF